MHRILFGQILDYFLACTGVFMVLPIRLSKFGLFNPKNVSISELNHPNSGFSKEMSNASIKFNQIDHFKCVPKTLQFLFQWKMNWNIE